MQFSLWAKRDLLPTTTQMVVDPLLDGASSSCSRNLTGTGRQK